MRSLPRTHSSADRTPSRFQCPGLTRVTAKVDFGGGDTAGVPAFLQLLPQLGKNGRLLFSLIVDSSY
jgi:hypothetical protein